jgi:hypothetical protein
MGIMESERWLDALNRAPGKVAKGHVSVTKCECYHIAAGQNLIPALLKDCKKSN